jgi:hypothetical protein
MGKVFICQAAVTAMAYHAANFTMCILQEIGVLQEDLFPDLQRR